MEMILCRHGETAWSLTGQHTGLTDLSLTDSGKLQAAKLREHLQKFHFDRILSSPLKRAQETAKLAGYSFEIDNDLREWNYGDYEGITSEEIRKRCPDWNIFLDGAPNGESPEEVSNRADHFIKKYQKEKGTLLLFSHGHFLRALTARWIGLSIKEAKGFSLSVASMGHLGVDRGTPVIKLWNLTPQ
jgi:broad specificity phosphatase PhoE